MTNQSNTPLMSLINISKKYQIGQVESLILNHISLNVYRGEMLAIVGASGSGKSTLMNLIGLLDTADSGQYHLQGHDVANLNDDELARLRNRSIGFVFQHFNLLSRLTAIQNVALPLSYRNIPYAQASKLAALTLDRVGMHAFASHRPMQLSGGQQQRIAIARALIGEPEFILADEPTGALDSNTSHEIMTLFLNLHQEGRTLIIVTHDERVASACTRQITLVDGEIETCS
ncbi:MAG: ABC transporter ATP-binding protein [Legionellaceae bacterium]|nr:ABC transporter ATP-binding protein [Legionellaceae bacterium]